MAHALVLVLTHQRDASRSALVGRCLDGLMKNTTPMAICVIDNGGPVPYYADRDGVEVVRHNFNYPFEDAFNREMVWRRKQSWDVVLRVTDDCVPEPGMVDAIVRSLMREPGVAAPATNHKGSAWLYAPAPDPHVADIECRHVNGIVFAISRETVELIGYPSCDDHPDWSCWGSNIDYCYRARKAGYLVRAVMSGYVWHDDTPSDPVRWRQAEAWLRSRHGDLGDVL